VSPTKTDEPIEMQFGLRDYVLDGTWIGSGKRHIFGIFHPIEKYRYIRLAVDMFNLIQQSHSNRERKCAENYSKSNDTVNLFFKTAIRISILVISNYNSFRVLFDKIASVYFI